MLHLALFLSLGLHQGDAPFVLPTVEGAYELTSSARDWSAAHPVLDLDARFAPSAVRFRGGGAFLEMELEAWGRGDALALADPAARVVDGERAEYRRGAITEWYVHGRSGVEHGFTIEGAPEGEGPLRLVVAIRGDVEVEVDEDGRNARFRDRARGATVNYTGLRSWDSEGRDLEARLVALEGALAIEVEDADAVYPLTVDPLVWTQRARLISPVPGTDAEFAKSISIFGDQAVVTSPGFNNDSGAAGLFARSGSDWSLSQPFTPLATVDPGDRWGFASDFDGTCAAVIMKPIGSLAFATAFTWDGTQWNTSVGMGSFGSIDDVAINGRWLAMGENGYVLTWSDTVGPFQGWNSFQTISEPLPNSAFGTVVAMSDDYLYVGAHGEDILGNAAGAVYVYQRVTPGFWPQHTVLRASDGQAQDRFGRELDVDGNRLYVGASGNNGAVYVFEENGGVFTELTKVTAGNTSNIDFGRSISADGSTLVAGGRLANSSTGEAHVFRYNGSTYDQGPPLFADDGVAGDRFGWAVGTSGGQALIGAPFADAGGFSQAGAMYVFDLGPTASYCTSGLSASGCQALMSATGAASATAPTGFVLSGSGVEGAVNGQFFFGANGRQANSWGTSSSYQCVTPPVSRAGILSGGGTQGACDGAFAQDLNARWTAKPAQNPGAGAVVQAQLWYRDSNNTSNQTTSLSDALEFCVGP